MVVQTAEENAPWTEKKKVAKQIMRIVKQYRNLKGDDGLLPHLVQFVKRKLMMNV